MASAILLVPPFLKVAYGPLLGPAMLLGAARRAGHEVRLHDLNAIWIRELLPENASTQVRSRVGDHDRPAALSDMHRAFMKGFALAEPRSTHDAVNDAAKQLASGPFGAWVTAQLARRPPDVIGVSVMYRDQVEPALATTLIARRLWPNALIVWGGAHVTALRDDIAIDTFYDCGGAIDRFVFGYAEQTWVDLLDAITKRGPLPEEAARAGCLRWLPARDDGSVVPMFDDVAAYDPKRLTLPLQSSRGCTYGACAYCTYPSIEGAPRELPWSVIGPVIERAIELGAALSFKDSLVEGVRLSDIAACVAGRVAWSACTKLDAALPERLNRLAAGGCRTLEVGLETLHPDAQALIKKRQKQATFDAFLDAAASAKIAVVVNYMTGLPTVDPGEEQRCMAIVEAALRARSLLEWKLEHNTFQLERLSPMAQAPENYGMHVTQRSPWNSELTWVLRPRLVTLRNRR